MKRVLTIVGARPQFVKAAMLSRVFSQKKEIDEVLVHTGQHYDTNMSEVFFEEMGIPTPTHSLAVGSASHAKQTALMIERLDAIYDTENPDATIVYGDTNSTLAGALVSAKRGIPVIHIEAGMRSGLRYQPEEINRITADHLSELLLCSSQYSADACKKEGITGNIVVVGDIMQDATLFFSQQQHTTLLEQLGVVKDEFILFTCHRPECTDNQKYLTAVIRALLETKIPIIFPAHPRTKKYLEEYGLLKEMAKSNIQIIEPVGYVEMLTLVKNAKRVVTDSGGLQKEAYWLEKPCVTIRERTEWVELVDSGWNIVTGYDAKKIKTAAETFSPKTTHQPLYGDGKAATHIYDAILTFFMEREE